MDTQPVIMGCSYLQDVSTNQSDLQIQRKSSQNPKDIFFTFKKHSKIPIQSQGTLNSQNDFEKEQAREYISWFQSFLHRYSNLCTSALRQTHRPVELKPQVSLTSLGRWGYTRHQDCSTGVELSPSKNGAVKAEYPPAEGWIWTWNYLPSHKKTTQSGSSLNVQPKL